MEPVFGIVTGTRYALPGCSCHPRIDGRRRWHEDSCPRAQAARRIWRAEYGEAPVGAWWEEADADGDESRGFAVPPAEAS